MDAKNIIKTLEDLHQLDVDAIHAYDEAIERVENSRVKSKLQEYKRDHENHVQRLEDLIVAKGGERPNRKRDIKGFLIEGMTLLRSSAGDEQAMKAMRQNEEVTNKKYSNAVESLRGEDSDVDRLLESAYSDERRHLTFIKEYLSYPEHFGGAEEERPSPGM